LKLLISKYNDIERILNTLHTSYDKLA
jgi:hypothetical protein